MKPRVIITGVTGLLGRELARVFSKRWNVLGVSRRRTEAVPGRNWRPVDIRNAAQVRRLVKEFQPQVIVHAAALAGIDYCEEHPLEAFETNTRGSFNLLKALSGAKTTFVFVSTDNVLDGRPLRGHREDAPRRPLNVYGWSKAWAEQLVKNHAPRHYIVRPGWMFGRGSNFVTQLLEGKKRLAAADWPGHPTSAADVAAAIEQLLLKRAPYGVYHVRNRGSATRWQVAEELQKIVGEKRLIQAVKSRLKDLPFTAKRLPRALMIDSKTRRAGLPPLRTWRSALREFIRGSQGDLL